MLGFADLVAAREIPTIIVSVDKPEYNEQLNAHGYAPASSHKSIVSIDLNTLWEMKPGQSFLVDSLDGEMLAFTLTQNEVRTPSPDCAETTTPQVTFRSITATRNDPIEGTVTLIVQKSSNNDFIYGSIRTNRKTYRYELRNIHADVVGFYKIDSQFEQEYNRCKPVQLSEQQESQMFSAISELGIPRNPDGHVSRTAKHCRGSTNVRLKYPPHYNIPPISQHYEVFCRGKKTDWSCSAENKRHMRFEELFIRVEPTLSVEEVKAVVKAIQPKYEEAQRVHTQGVTFYQVRRDQEFDYRVIFTWGCCFTEYLLAKIRDEWQIVRGGDVCC